MTGRRHILPSFPRGVTNSIVSIAHSATVIRYEGCNIIVLGVITTILVGQNRIAKVYLLQAEFVWHLWLASGVSTVRGARLFTV